jgi:hypothetical protein
VRFLGVQITIRPYFLERDNHLELACVIVLLFEYFTSVSAGSAGSISAIAVDAVAAVVRVAILVYWAWRTAGRRAVKLWRRYTVTAGSEVERAQEMAVVMGAGDDALSAPLMDTDQRSE